MKAVLLHNRSQLPSIPLAYATNMKEAYGSLSKILRFINYNKHKWQIVSDLKVLNILFGMQGGYTKSPCYLCEWDSRNINHNAIKVWPPRTSFQIGKKKILNVLFVESDKIILPLLHLKLGYMKQFVKKMDGTAQDFAHLQKMFPGLSEAKLKEGISHWNSPNSPYVCKCFVNYRNIC